MSMALYVSFVVKGGTSPRYPPLLGLSRNLALLKVNRTGFEPASATFAGCCVPVTPPARPALNHARDHCVKRALSKVERGAIVVVHIAPRGEVC